jgi:ubiquinone/menaquinone biosynthesis C-methylase UbiE
MDPPMCGATLGYDAANMSSADTRFVGSIPAIYDTMMGPLFFEPYAQDLAARVRSLPTVARVLETAAGTGIVTRALARVLPQTAIVATDLNDAMLKVAAANHPSGSVTWKQADAQALPFGDAEFDALVCQFGLMFFPDKPAGLRQARRVLRSGGHLFFNVWDRLDRNPLSAVVGDAVSEQFPGDPPQFLSRGPFGWNDAEEIRRLVQAAGFEDVAVETVEKVTNVASALGAAQALCQGSPLRNEIEARAPERLDAITIAVADALTNRFGAAPFENHMSALVVVARA